MGRIKKALVYEDFESIRKILIRLLERKDFEILEAHNMQDIDNFLNGTTIDLFIVDNDMKNNAATIAISKLRDLTNYMFTPVILLITGEKSTYSDKMKDLNIACYLTKPFDMSHFYSVIDRLV